MRQLGPATAVWTYQFKQHLRMCLNTYYVSPTVLSVCVCVCVCVCARARARARVSVCAHVLENLLFTLVR